MKYKGMRGRPRRSRGIGGGDPDRSPPTVPGNLVLTVTGPDSIQASWSASTDDDSGLRGYRVYLDTGYQGEFTTLNWSRLGLAVGTYLVGVSAIDESGNESQQVTDSVTIAADSTGPVISNIAETHDHDSALITWTTDEPATSRVNFGITTSYGGNVSEAALVTSHSIDLTGLIGSTVYNFEAVSVDAAGNSTDSVNFTFTTDATPDTTAPIISGISVTPSDIGAVVTWTTNEPATSVVDYGTTTAYGSTETVAGTRTSHSVTITGLTPSSPYNLRITSVDPSGNSASSANQSFSTQAPADSEAPTAPQNERGRATGATQAVIAFDGATDNVGVIAYDIYRDDVKVGEVTP